MRRTLHGRLLRLAGVLILAGAAVLVAFLASGTVWRRPGDSMHLREIPVGKFLAIDVLSDRTAIDLDFREATRYVIVVSSLSDASRQYSVRLEAEPVPAPCIHSARPVRPLTFRCIRRMPQSSQRASLEANASADEIPLRPHRSTKGASESGPGLKTLRHFFLHVADGDLNDPNGYARITAHVIAEGQDTRLFLDGAQSTQELAPGVIDDVVHSLDEQIIPRLRQSLGEYRDVDGDGKIAVLLTPWLSKLQGGRTSLGGLVCGSDFRCDCDPPYSNQCDMLFINSQVTSGPHLESLLAHEFAHAVCFSERLPTALHPEGLPEEEDWLNEAIAHVAEQLRKPNYTNLDYRISRFLNATHEFPLVVPDYYRAGMWRNHGCRGATYLFLSWCVREYGTGLLSNLVASPFTGRRSLEWATGLSFDELYRRWSIALIEADNQTPHGLTQFPEANAAAERFPRSNSTSGPSEREPDDSRASIPWLCLHEPLGEWGLAGPRYVRVDVDRASPTLSLRGTSTAYFEVHASGAPGTRRIHLRGDYGSALQVSLLKRPDDWPTIEIERAAFERKDAVDNSPGTDSTACALSVQVSGRGSPGLRIQSLACEQNQGETKESVCFTEDRLNGYLQETSDSQGEASTWQFRLPLPNTISGKSTWTVKVVAVNEQGRWAGGWAEVDDRPGIQVAAQDR